jgi:hypothetical protein
MEKLFFICLLSISVNTQLFAQGAPHFDQIKLKKQKDYRLADSTVMQTSNYLLSTPINQDSTSRIKSAQFLMKWMDGTTDYTFVLNENTTRYFIDDIHLMAVYMAALCKTAVQSKPGINSKKITLNAIKLVLDYANNNSNNVKWTDQLKQLSDANKKGELERYLEQ